MLTLKDIPPPCRVSKASPTPYHFMLEPTGSPGATEYHYAGPDAPGMPHAARLWEEAVEV